jgi:Tfp pilus assembly major pilin PilA
MKNKTSKKYFTLLELLVIVGILAIVGGSLITAYDGLTAQAAKATATHSIAGVTNSVRAYNVTEKSLPNNLESLLAVTPTTVEFDTDLHDNVATAVATDAAKAGLLGSKLAGKFSVRNLNETQLGNLRDAGIDTVRYIDLLGNDEATADLTIENADGVAAAGVGAISQIDIPQLAFGVPRNGSGRNRGRGFAYDISAAAATAVEFMVWGVKDDAAFDPDAPVPTFDNVKVGADADAVLVGFGIGNDSTIVGVDSNKDGGVGNVRFNSAPFYGDVGKNEYSHYIMLVDVEQSPAKLVAVVDARGDFLVEEFAEANGQKQ